MKLYGNPEIFVPDGRPISDALNGVKYLGIGAHQDDLEFMALHGINEGYKTRSFAGVTCTDGRSRIAIPGNDQDKEEIERYAATRRAEQNEAATIGRYAAMIQLDFSSRIIKDPTTTLFRDNLQQVLSATRPRVVYTHNPADRHDTHVAVVCAVVEAIRTFEPTNRPKTLYGCEVWGDLDWLPEDDKARVSLDVSRNAGLARKLNAVFASQIWGTTGTGGKRYDLAVEGRRRANATFSASHEQDTFKAVTIAMDLTPLISEPVEDTAAYVDRLTKRFRQGVQGRLQQNLRK